MAPVLGPPNQNCKGRGQKQGRKMAPFSGSKTRSNVFFFLIFFWKKKWTYCGPILKERLAPLVLKTDILEYADWFPSATDFRQRFRKTRDELFVAGSGWSVCKNKKEVFILRMLYSRVTMRLFGANPRCTCRHVRPRALTQKTGSDLTGALNKNLPGKGLWHDRLKKKEQIQISRCRVFG